MTSGVAGITSYRAVVISSGKVDEASITLRTLTVDDLDGFYLWASDHEVAKTMTWKAYTSKSDAERFLTEVAAKHPWFKAICLDGIPVGSMTLTPGTGDSSCRAELGYVLAQEFWGRGIATLAIKHALRTGFDELGIQRIEAFVASTNTASCKALSNAGMNCEALLKRYKLLKGNVCDMYVYSSTR